MIIDEAALAASNARIKEADDEVHQSMVAFETGHFVEYFEAKVAKIRERLEKEHVDSFDKPDANATTGSG